MPSPPCRAGRSPRSRVRDELEDEAPAQPLVELQPEAGQLDRDVRVEAVLRDRGERVAVRPAIALGLLGRAISSPSTSTVARMPSALRRRDHAPRVGRASSRRCTATPPGGRSSAAPQAAHGRRRGRTTSRIVDPALFAHEALAGGGDESDGLGEEDAHRVAELQRLLVDRAGRLRSGRAPPGSGPRRSTASASRTARAAPP